jgi:hypothetical protein
MGKELKDKYEVKKEELENMKSVE